MIFIEIKYRYYESILLFFIVEICRILYIINNKKQTFNNTNRYTL